MWYNIYRLHRHLCLGSLINCSFQRWWSLFSIQQAKIRTCGPRRCKAGILAKGQIRRSYPSLGRTPFCPRRCECASLAKGQEAPKLPPLGLFPVREISAIVIHGGCRPASPGGTHGLGPERPGASALGSPGRPRPPFPSFVPPFPEAEGVRSGASDSGPQAEGDRPRSPERNRRRNGAGPERGL